MLSRALVSRFAAVLSLIAIVAAPAAADWTPDDGHKMHFPQLPDPTGFDVNFLTPIVLADDWKCSETGPVRDIHFWFSAQNDWFDPSLPLDQQIFNIHLSIHANQPPTPGGPPFATPGTLLWQRDFSVAEVRIIEWGAGTQWWFDPSTGLVTADDHQKIYLCNVKITDQPFYQKRDQIYWLDISIQSEAPLGWKSADLNAYPPPYTGTHFASDGVWRIPPAGWQDLYFPNGPFEGESMDLAFVINGSPAQWNHKMHFPQPPDPVGADVWFNPPFVVADDWQCSESGFVTDIHFWFSAYEDWLDFNQPLSGQIGTIHVSIHEDIPDPDGTGPLYSMPGALLWERDYAVDEVRVTKCYTPGQAWFAPELGEYIPDNHYCLYRVDINNIAAAFEQEQGKIYWLDIWMDGQGPLGWKTADVDRYPAPYTGGHFQDDGVWAFIGAAPNWAELIWPANAPRAGQSIDLAFVITKDPPTDAGENTPGPFHLEQNYPNPFNPTTTIRYSLAEPSEVTLAVYDVTGALVKVLEKGSKPEGTFEAVWNGRDASGAEVASGVYFYRLEAGSFSETRKMVLMK